jgi:hypothetical protein
MTKVSHHSMTIIVLIVAILIIVLSACAKQNIARHVDDMGNTDSHLRSADHCLNILLIIGIVLFILKLWSLFHRHSRKE